MKTIIWIIGIIMVVVIIILIIRPHKLDHFNIEHFLFPKNPLPIPYPASSRSTELHPVIVEPVKVGDVDLILNQPAPPATCYTRPPPELKYQKVQVPSVQCQKIDLKTNRLNPLDSIMHHRSGVSYYRDAGFPRDLVDLNYLRYPRSYCAKYPARYPCLVRSIRWNQNVPEIPPQWGRSCPPSKTQDQADGHPHGQTND